MEEHYSIAPDFEVLPSERERLVRLCAHLTGRVDVAEDLAQETLLEAWRQRHKLQDPAGQAQWLSAIARNICLRWRQRQGREREHFPSISREQALGSDLEEVDQCAGDVDLEIDLERQELAELLDRALDLLPTVTRQALVHRYVEDLPHGEIAARLRMSESAVAVRVHRGKLALRRVLLQDMSRSDGGYLPQGADGSWETTRLWCGLCGTRRLLGRMCGEPVVMALRCPGGCDGPCQYQMQCPVPGSPVGMGYGRAASRVRSHADRHYGLNRPEGEPRCPGCGRPTPLRVGAPQGLPEELQTPGVHVYLHCAACGSLSHSSLAGIALSLPEAQRFARKHPRVRPYPHQEIEVEGLPAFLCRFESLEDGARLDVLVRQEAFRLIAVHGTPKA